MANINFDEFEREILHAEIYLNSASTKGQQEDVLPTQQPHRDYEQQDTLFFASDLHNDPPYQEEMMSFGLSTSLGPSTSIRGVDPLMNTMRFGPDHDSSDIYETGSLQHSTSHREDDHMDTLFYASDVVPSQHAYDYGRTEPDEEMMSFLPSPQQTQRIDFANTSQSELSASLAETVRFTKPVEPALRSVDLTALPHRTSETTSQPQQVRPSTTTSAVSTTATSRTNSRANSTSRSRPSSATSGTTGQNTSNQSRSYSAPRHRTSINNTNTTHNTQNTTTNTTNNSSNTTSSSPSPPKRFVRQPYIPENFSFGPRRSAQAISMERIDELHRKRVAAKQELLKKKRALDELQLAECTFQPQISKGTKNILHQKQLFEQLDADCRTVREGTTVRDVRTAHNVHNAQDSPTTATVPVPPQATDVSERLYREASIRTAQQHWINAQVEHLRSSQYTFQPSIHTHHHHSNSSAGRAATAHAPERRPIHQRIADMMKEKKQYMLALKTSIEQEQVDLTFTPAIDARSRVIAQQKLIGYGANHNLPRTNTAAHNTTFNNTTANTSGKENATTSNTLSGEQQMALVLGFNTDVGSRLNDQGRAMVKRKQMLAYQRDNELAKAMEPVSMSKGSARIVQKTDLKETFEERQAQYKQREYERQQAQLKEREYLSSNWFTPQIDPHSTTLLHAQRPELSLESVEQKVQRLSVHDAQELESRRQARAAAMYGAIPFTPTIDALSRSLGRSSSIEDLVQNRRALTAREKIRAKLEEEESQACTFKPQINPLSKQLLQPSADDVFLQKYNSDFAQVGWSEHPGCVLDGLEPSIRDSYQRTQNGRINMNEPEKMQRDIRMHALAKEEKRRSELIAREIADLRECTFHPSIDHSFASLEKQRADTSPVVIRGLGRFLELKHLTARQKEEALQREKEVFGVKNIEQFRRAEDGSTVVQAFNFNLTEPRQHSRLDISGVEIHPGSLNASTILSHKSHRQPTSATAAAAWCM